MQCDTVRCSIDQAIYRSKARLPEVLPGSIPSCQPLSVSNWRGVSSGLGGRGGEGRGVRGVQSGKNRRSVNQPLGVGNINGRSRRGREGDKNEFLGPIGFCVCNKWIFCLEVTGLCDSPLCVLWWYGAM